MNRRTAREKAIQALFQIDVGKVVPEEAIEHVMEDTVDDTVDDFLAQVVRGTIQNQTEIDTIIKEHLEKWKLERIANVDRAILRLAVYEMCYIDEIPLNVSINEAVELAKIFGDDDSSKFINGVLSNIKDKVEGRGK